MSPDVVRWLVAIAVLGHGIGHVLFMPALAGSMKLQSSGHSWLLTDTVGDGPTRLIATVVGGGLVVAFAIVAGGILQQTPWWRGLALVAAVVSIMLVLAMFDGLLQGPATAALAFDAVVLVALLVVQWPARDLIGA